MKRNSATQGYLREGKVGGWMDHFSPHDAERVQARVRETEEMFMFNTNPGAYGGSST